MDDNNELTIYVLQQLRYGVPEQTIRQTLAQNGWPQALIDRAFSMVQQAAPHDLSPDAYQQGTSQPADLSLPATTLPQQAEQQQTVVQAQAPALPPPKDPNSPAGTPRQGRKLLLALMILILLAGASVGGFLIYKVMRDHNSKTSTSTTGQQLDANQQRKDDIKAIADSLMRYYDAKKTYPTIDQINAPDFVASDRGFDTSNFKDPKWNAKASCANEDGNPVFTTDRTNGCYRYRATASNGADCNTDDVKCTRVVLTANLSNNKPYIVALDHNRKE